MIAKWLDYSMLSDSVDERTCPACKQIFKKISGRNSHLKQARKCAWYNRQLFEFPEDSDCETDSIEQSGGTGDEIANDSVLDTDISLEALFYSKTLCYLQLTHLKSQLEKKGKLMTLVLCMTIIPWQEEYSALMSV